MQGKIFCIIELSYSRIGREAILFLSVMLGQGVRLLCALCFCLSTLAAPCAGHLRNDPSWKLIRDQLPAIFAREGEKAEVAQVTDPNQFKFYLLRKLREEVGELVAQPCVEEMADVLEVLEALEQKSILDSPALERARTALDAFSRVYALDAAEILAAKRKKATQKGGFMRGYIMRQAYDQ